LVRALEIDHKQHRAEISLSNPVIFPSQNRKISTVRHPHFGMLVVSVQSTGMPDAQPVFAPISATF
jgi:hypothetical protein